MQLKTQGLSVTTKQINRLYTLTGLGHGSKLICGTMRAIKYFSDMEQSLVGILETPDRIRTPL